MRTLVFLIAGYWGLFHQTSRPYGCGLFANTVGIAILRSCGFSSSLFIVWTAKSTLIARFGVSNLVCFMCICIIYIKIFTEIHTFYTFFLKQFTVGVLNATLDLAALVLVGVAAFLGSEVVLAPFGSLHVGVGIGWCGRLLGL